MSNLFLVKVLQNTVENIQTMIFGFILSRNVAGKVHLHHLVPIVINLIKPAFVVLFQAFFDIVRMMRIKFFFKFFKDVLISMNPIVVKYIILVRKDQ